MSDCEGFCFELHNQTSVRLDERNITADVYFAGNCVSAASYAKCPTQKLAAHGLIARASPAPIGME